MIIKLKHLKQGSIYLKTINEVVESGKCTGCAACANICARNSIKMMPNDEGFYYPKIIESCVNCGSCLNVCPILQKKQGDKKKSISYAYYSEINSKFGRSSSSGVFEVIARHVIDNGGVVCGAAFDANWNVRHTIVDSVDDIKLLCTSKYVQSFIEEDLYKKIYKISKEKIVLFAGTPCQVAALHNFAKEKKNLITVDIVCHGIPSPKIWRRYLESISCGKKVTDINFRDKRCESCYGLKISYADNEFYESVTQNAYLQGYINNLYIRNSCTYCEFKGDNHTADITLGDLWHAEKVDLALTGKHNVSWVIINTDAGAALERKIRSNFWVSEIDINKEIIYNQSYCSSSQHHKNRSVFFDSLTRNDIDISTLIKECIKTNFLEKVINKLEKTIHQMFK